jgi:hypothetical protein
MLRAVFGAAAAAVLLTLPAAAQTTLPSACAFTPAPAIPDGATATNAAMVAARETLQQWRTTRSAEIAACRAVVDQTQAQLNAVQSAHNQAVTDTDAAIAQFAAENAKYAARARPRREGSSRPGQ